MTFTLIDFIRESNRIEGIEREPYEREIEAHQDFLLATIPTVGLLEVFVEQVQPGATLHRGFGQNVMVGNHIPPRGGPNVEASLNALLQCVTEPWTTHCRYEDLHPFMDGNGRSGRVLWLHRMGGIAEAPLGFLHHFYYQTLSQRRVA